MQKRLTGARSRSHDAQLCAPAASHPQGPAPGLGRMRRRTTAGPRPGSPSRARRSWAGAGRRAGPAGERRVLDRTPGSAQEQWSLWCPSGRSSHHSCTTGSAMAADGISVCRQPHRSHHRRRASHFASQEIRQHEGDTAAWATTGSGRTERLSQTGSHRRTAPAMISITRPGVVRLSAGFTAQALPAQNWFAHRF